MKSSQHRQNKPLPGKARTATGVTGGKEREGARSLLRRQPALALISLGLCRSGSASACQPLKGMDGGVNIVRPCRDGTTTVSKMGLINGAGTGKKSNSNSAHCGRFAFHVNRENTMYDAALVHEK